MIDSRTECAQARFLFLHVRKVCQIALSDLGARLLLVIGQNVRGLIHQRIGILDGRPECLRALQRSAQYLLQVLQGWRKTFFPSTRAMESLICVSRSCNLSPEASNGARPSSVRELRTAKQ